MDHEFIVSTDVKESLYAIMEQAIPTVSQEKIRILLRAIESILILR